MQDTTNRGKKKGAIICAAVVIGILIIYLAVILFPLMDAAFGEMIAVGFLLVYGAVIIAVIAGILAALRQRLKEIEGGEEEDAKKY